MLFLADNEDAEALGISQNLHDSTPDATLTWSSGDLAARNAWIASELSKADSLNCPYWEFGNELSSSLGASYATDWLLPMRNLKTQNSNRVKLMTAGTAGPSIKFLQNFYNAGGWPSIDAVALHAARGNCTADYPGENEEAAKIGADYWCFLGAVRLFKDTIAQYGDKPLVLTEAYACTIPNNFWYDSYRDAADNVILTYAISMAENVQRTFFYQLNDGVYYDQNGIKPNNPEYYYGLLNRDLSPKPSMVAYATIAEALDKATFVRWMLFSNLDAHGLMFDTPRGPMAILWNRIDCYHFTNGITPYAAPELWVDPWPTKVPTYLATSSTAATALDSIGLSTASTATDSIASITTDGAPRIVYGLQNSIGMNGTYRFCNRASGMYLDNSGATADGTFVVQATSGTSTNQQWALADNGVGYYKLTCLTGGKALDNLEVQ